MATRILSLLQIFGARATSTSTAPNSWAAISLWRRFFEWKDEQELQKIEAVCEVLRVHDDDDCPGSPVRSERARVALTQFMRDTDHLSTRQRVVPVFANPPPVLASQNANGAHRQQQQQQQQGTRSLDSPDLRVDSMFLAQ